MKKSILAFLMLATLIQASEEVPTQEEVAKLYVATFNRAPDSAGLAYWTNDSGLALSKIAQSFFDQEETKTLYPDGTSNSEFITSVYANLFNRIPDTAGLEYWVTELDRGAFTKNSFIQAVINGAKNTDTSNDADILSNKTTVGLYFSTQGLNDSIQAKSVLQNVSATLESVISAKDEIENLQNVSSSLLPIITTGEIATTNFLYGPGKSGIDYVQGAKDGDTMYYVNEVLTSPDDVFSFNLSIPNDDTLYGEVAGKTIPYVGLLTFPTTDDNLQPNLTQGPDPLPHMQSITSPLHLKESNKKYPLIIYSHGQGDHPLGSNIPTIIKRLAQNGYIVLALAHGDFRFKSLYDMDLKNFQEFALRPLSVKTAIDFLQSDAYFQTIIDFEKIGAMGSSLGGANMWMLAGASILGPSIFSTRSIVSDSRIKAFVGIAPLSGITYPVFGLGASGIQDVSKPMLVFSTADDTVIPADNIQSAMSKLNNKSNKKLVLLSGEPHVPSSDGLEIVAQWAIPFYKAYLENDALSKAQYDAALSSSFGKDSIVDINK